MRKLSEIRKAAKTFVNKWAGKGKERQDDKTFGRICWKMFLEFLNQGTR